MRLVVQSGEWPGRACAHEVEPKRQEGQKKGGTDQGKLSSAALGVPGDAPGEAGML